MKTLKAWIERVYADNGVWPTLIVGLIIVTLLAAGMYFDVNWAGLLP